MKRVVIVIAIRSFAKYSTEPSDILEWGNYKLVKNETGVRLSEDVLSDFLKDADGVIAGTEKYSAKSLKKAMRLKVISRVGMGIENIDLEYASKRGIRVLNTPEKTLTSGGRAYDGFDSIAFEENPDIYKLKLHGVMP